MDNGRRRIRTTPQRKKNKMNAKTLEAITRHGKALLEAFPKATEQNPVALCKKLRRIENSLTKPLTDYCNGDCGAETVDKANKSALNRVFALLRPEGVEIFVNQDPRGYALKIDDVWTREHNKTAAIRLYSDMGGYGIIAPDLNS